jgi:hypothetical protein
MNQGACTLEVPIGSVSIYKSANVWKAFNIVGIEVGIVETDNEPSLQVYPNPTNGQLFINDIETQGIASSDIQIYDIMGRHILIGQSKIGQSKITLNVSHLPVGVYFLRIGNKTARFVKE